MKKIFALCLMALIGTFAASAQKYALIDMDFILKRFLSTRSPISSSTSRARSGSRKSRPRLQKPRLSISSTRPTRSISPLSRRPSVRTLSSPRRRKFRTCVSSTSDQKVTSIRSATAS